MSRSTPVSRSPFQSYAGRDFEGVRHRDLFARWSAQLVFIARVNNLFPVKSSDVAELRWTEV